jgi:hypothetical protein
MEATKATLLQSLAILDAAALNRKPNEGTWSILQVVSHLTRSEAGTLQYIKKKTQDPAALLKAGIAPWFRIAVLVAGIHSPMKFKAPKAAADVPESGDFLAASLAWAEVREDWREFLEGFPEVLKDRLIFRHPFVGLLGPAQVLIFLNQHLGNHVRQIGRIRKALSV